MPDQSTPEIETLRMVAERPDEDSITQFEPFVTLDRAIQAVRDTEARVRDHYALSGRALREVGEAVRNSTLTDAQKVGVIAGVLANGPLDDAPGGPCEGAVFAARREAFREAVEALRELRDKAQDARSYEEAKHLRDAADNLFARLLSSSPTDSLETRCVCTQTRHGLIPRRGCPVHGGPPTDNYDSPEDNA